MAWPTCKRFNLFLHLRNRKLLCIDPTPLWARPTGEAVLVLERRARAQSNDLGGVTARGASFYPKNLRTSPASGQWGREGNAEVEKICEQLARIQVGFILY